MTSINIIMKGTERDTGKAKECFQQVIDRFGKTEDGTVYLQVLRARVHLGNRLYMERAMDQARQQYEAIYTCPEDRLGPLPSERFESEEERVSRQKWIAGEVRRLKGVVRKHIVQTCIRQDMVSWLAELDKIQAKYQDDAEMAEQVKQARRMCLERMLDLKKLEDDAMNNLGKEGSK